MLFKALGPRQQLLTSTRIFLLIGQSNMVGRGPYDSGALHPSGVRQWGREDPNNNTLIPATQQLEHHDPGNNQIGLDIDFSIAFKEASPSLNLVLVPSADGGTSLVSGDWQKGGALYEDAVNRAIAAIAAVPDGIFAGALWHQGEADANQANANYQAQLDQMILDFRADVNADPNFPFILGGLAPAFVGSDPTRQAIQAIIEDTPNRVANTAYVATADLTTLVDNIHFNTASLRSLGARYYLQWALLSGLQAPQAVGTIPNQFDEAAPPIAVGTIPDQSDVVAA